MKDGPGHTGLFQSNNVENQEAVLNLVSFWVAAQSVGVLRAALFDTNGNPSSFPSVGSTPVSGTTTVATAGTPQRISVASVTIKGIWLNADIIEGIPVVVGDSGVVGNVSGQKGIILIPGNDPVFMAISELNTLWVDATQNGGKLAWTYIT